MSRKVYQIVDPETGEVVAEKREGILGEPQYSPPSERQIRRILRMAAHVYALLSSFFLAVILLLEELVPFFAEISFSDLGLLFIPGIILVFAWGIRTIRDAVEKDETIRYAKHVGKEKTYHVIDTETGKKENETFFVVTDSESYTEASLEELEPRRSMEQQEIERMERENENTIKRMNKEQEYHIVDPQSGKTVAKLRRTERVLREEAPKPKSLRVAEKIGAVCIFFFWPLIIAAYFASEKLRPYFLLAIAVLTGMLIVLEFIMDGLAWFGQRHKNRKEE